MGIILSCCAWAACSCCIGLSCSCCGYAMTLTKSIATRVWYTGTFLIVSAIAWLLSMWAYEIFGWIPWDTDGCTSCTCGTFSVYKITFPLFIYHTILAIFLIGVKNSKDPRSQFNDGWWALKIPALILMTVGCFLIPYEFYLYYGWFAVFGAGIFVVIQLIVLIDFAYSWNDSWVAKWNPTDYSGSLFKNENENQIWYYLLLGASFVLFGFAVVLDVLMYVLFSGCWYNPTLVTLNILICIVLTVLSILPVIRKYNPSIGLLQASVFSAYCTYLIWSAIFSEPTECYTFTLDWVTDENPYHTDWITLIFGGIFTIVSVVYASFRVGSSDTFSTSSSSSSPSISPIENNVKISNALVTGAPVPNAMDPNGEDSKESDSLVGTDGPLSDDLDDHDDLDDIIAAKDDELQSTAYNYTLFHLTFALGALYVAMLLTNWSIIPSSFSPDDTECDSPETDFGWTAVSVKLVSCVAAAGLYAWTIFAPVILKNRDFGYDNSIYA